MITIDVKEAIRCNGEYSLFVSFPYDTTVIDTIRTFPTKYWNSEEKNWELPTSKLGEFINKLPNYEFNIKGVTTPFEPKVSEIPTNFNFKTTPFNHQVEGFTFGLNNDRWLLGDEQGLGKTKQVIDIAVAKKLQKGYKHCLIICGVNGLKWNWQNEISIHSNEVGYILGQRTKGIKTVVGSTKDKLYDLTHLDDLNAYFIITNVESLRDTSIITKLSELCASKDINMIAADECHKMKNPTSQQGKGFLKLNTETMIAMTGTPLMNTPLDLYIILKWLGYEKHSFYAFRNHYCEMGGFGGYQIVGYKNLDELQEQLNDIMLRRLKNDVLDLPDKIFIDEFVEMTSKQAVIYKEVTNDIKANIDQIKVAPNPLAQLIRMRQATGYTGILSSTIMESVKLDRMEELVDEAVNNGKQVVIFSNWTQMTTPAIQRLARYNPAVITGETSDSDRQRMVEGFQNGTNKVIVGTIGAMGTGLTLTAGTVEIFLDEPWTMAAKNQAVDRCHRIGANENVTIYTLLAKNTIDERIHEIVFQKGAMSNALIDGQITGNKSDIVDYLLS